MSANAHTCTHTPHRCRTWFTLCCLNANPQDEIHDVYWMHGDVVWAGQEREAGGEHDLHGAASAPHEGGHPPGGPAGQGQGGRAQAPTGRHRAAAAGRARQTSLCFRTGLVYLPCLGLSEVWNDEVCCGYEKQSNIDRKNASNSSLLSNRSGLLALSESEWSMKWWSLLWSEWHQQWQDEHEILSDFEQVLSTFVWVWVKCVTVKLLWSEQQSDAGWPTLSSRGRMKATHFSLLSSRPGLLSLSESEWCMWLRGLL